MQKSDNGKRVLIIGDANVDLIVPYPKHLDGGGIIYPEFNLNGGGTAANTAAALAKLGVNVEFMGTVGDDAYGRHAVAEFAELGIDAAPLVVDKDFNTVCVFAFVDNDGERYLWGFPREKQSFKELAADKIRWDYIDNADWIHSSGMIMTYDTSARQSIIEIFKRAHNRGIPTSFDLNLRVENGELDESYRQSVLEIIKYCTFVLGSGQEELYYLNPQPDWFDSAKGLVTDSRAIIARMGAKGSMALSREVEFSALPCDVAVVDTVGAGDVYNAGFIASQIWGKSLEEAVVWGNGISSYKVARKGSRATPDFAELKAFLKQYGTDINK